MSTNDMTKWLTFKLSIISDPGLSLGRVKRDTKNEINQSSMSECLLFRQVTPVQVSDLITSFDFWCKFNY